MRWWCAATGATWRGEWIAYPGVWAFVASLACLYALIVRRAGVVPRWKLATFTGGLLVLWIALDWPIGTLGAGYLASVHMVQFLLIGMLAPPLLLYGIPDASYRSLERRPRLIGFLRVWTHPVFALVVLLVSMGATHWPVVVDTLMASQIGSFALDMVWLVAGLTFAWPVAAPVPVRPWLNHPVKMGHLLAASVVNTGVFAFLTFTTVPVYEIYELAPPVSALSARDDQLLAGLLMKMGGAPIMFTWMSILFFSWYAESQRDDEATMSASRSAG
jgi:cytochrome c oxidase assembly factor CtaG